MEPKSTVKPVSWHEVTEAFRSYADDEDDQAFELVHDRFRDRVLEYATAHPHPTRRKTKAPPTGECR